MLEDSKFVPEQFSSEGCSPEQRSADLVSDSVESNLVQEEAPSRFRHSPRSLSPSDFRKRTRKAIHKSIVVGRQDSSEQQSWLFADSPESMVFTVQQIIFNSAPVLHVTHDSDDGAWQFLQAESPLETDAAACTLEYMLRADESLASIADLPLGWRAIREFVGAPWRREPNPFDGD